MSARTPIQQLVVHEFESAARGELAVAMSVLLSANRQASISRCLKDCISEGCVFSPSSFNNIFIVSRGKSSPIEQVNQLLEKLSENVYFETSFHQNPNLIIIELGARNTEFCSREIAAVSHLHLDKNGYLINSLTHELTHAFCSSGNRFLDEGLAMFMEKEVAGDIKDYEATLRSVNPSNSISDYRDLVVQLADAGCFLSSEEKYSPLYIQAMHLVANVARSLPKEKLFSTFQTLGHHQSGLEHYRALLKWTNQDQPPLHEELPPLPSQEEVTRLIIDAGLTHNLPTQFSFWLDVFGRIDPVKLPIQALILYLKLLVEELWYKNFIGCTSLRSSINNVLFLLEEFQPKLNSNASYYILNAQVEALELAQTSMPLEIADRFSRYKDWVARAVNINPDQHDVIFESAKLNLFDSRLSTEPAVYLKQFRDQLSKLTGTAYERLVETLQ